MIFYIIFVYWILSTLIVGMTILPEKDSFGVGVIVGFVSILFGWLILPVLCVFYIFELLKKKFL